MAFLAGDDVDIRIVLIRLFQKKRIAARLEAGTDRVVAVDRDKISLRIFKRIGELFRIDFDREIKAVRVVDDIFLCGAQGIHTVFQCDQSFLGKNFKDTAVIRNGIGSDDMRTVGKFIQTLVFP